jgi:hypothetical protein
MRLAVNRVGDYPPAPTIDRINSMSVSNGHAIVATMDASAELRRTSDPLVDACLATLRTLGPSIEAKFLASRTLSERKDGELGLRHRRRGPKERFVVRITRTHLSYALAAGFIEQARILDGNWVLFAPYVPPKIGQHLAAHNLSYVDAIGNCHLQVAQGRELLAHVEGKKPKRGPSGRSGGRVPSYQLLFAILAEPALLNKPTRQIATAAGVGKTAVADQLTRLIEQGLVTRTRSGRAIARRRELLDRWLSAYADVVRPTWLIGRYRTQTTDPEALEHQIEVAWGDQVWAFGGGAAAWRMTHFYRGPDTVLHVHELPAEMIRHLRAIPAGDGSLTILRTPGSIAYAGSEPHLVHPLLVYAEMVSSADPRMREAAAELRQRFLSEPT